MKLYKAKVADENEYVIGKLINDNSIFQPSNKYPHSKYCGFGIFAVDETTIEEYSGELKEQIIKDLRRTENENKQKDA